jgi:hypothetical protein
LSYILFFVYLALCCFLLTKIRFITNAGLGVKTIIALFLVKVSAGLLNGLISLHYTNYVTDTELFHLEGLKEYHLLFANPKEYFLDLFRSKYSSGYSGLFQTNESYWNDLKFSIIFKLLSIFDVFSFGNYYINVVFFNFIIFFGHVGLFRVFTDVYKDKKCIVFISCFLLPSLLYLSNYINKDGLILAAIGIVIFNIYHGLNSGFTFPRLFYILFSVCFIFILRDFIFIAILPAILAWVIAHKRKSFHLLTFVVIYSVGLIIFFNINYFFPGINLPQIVVQRQADFENLPKPKSYLPVDTLYPTFKSFLQNTPQALNHSLMRPYFSESRISIFIFPFAAEIFLYELLFLLFIFFRKSAGNVPDFKNPFILFILFFSISVLIVIGYTIPVIGAIVRYRSIYLPFILTPILCNINWKDFKAIIQIKK